MPSPDPIANTPGGKKCSADDPPGKRHAPCQRNIEVKFRVKSLSPVRRAVEGLADQRLEDQRQTDTYFTCRHGRLKLREIDGRPPELISYQRGDEAAARDSHYRLVPVVDAAALRQALGDALGIRCVVEKHREIWLYRNVRIHLDRVTDLGEFVELESVLGDDCPEATARERLEHLLRVLPLPASGIIAFSYSDLLLGGDAAVPTDGMPQAEL